MVSFSLSNEWKSAHPGAVIGCLEVRDVNNTVLCPELDSKKRNTEAALREKFKGFSRADFKAVPVLAAYEAYYRSFEKSYHVQLQLESIVLKDKPLPNVSPLVDSNFVAEVETLVLTAGHDVEKLGQQVSFDISKPGDAITQMNGSTKPMREGDMIMRDEGGVCCSIIYGQDNRSPITRDTTHVLYVAYGPPGVSPEVVRAQLGGILENIKTFAPECNVVNEELFIVPK